MSYYCGALIHLCITKHVLIMVTITKDVIKNRLQTLLNQTTVNDLTPNNHQLTEMGMSKKRFTNIKRNKGNELYYSEAIKLCEWLKNSFSVLENLKPWELYDYSNPSK